MRKGNTRFGVLMFMLAFGAWLASPTVGRAQQVPTLDPNFKPVIAVPGGFLTAVAVQTDAKILVAGGFNAINGIARNGLARLNADGSVDSTFDAGSVCCGVGLNSSQGTSPITALCLQPDGKLLAGGYFTNINGVARGGLARLNADGTLDSTFDPGSGLSFVSGAPSVAPVAKFVLQPDGKVLVGGYFSGVNGVGRNGVARLNANGSLDATFNPGSALAIGDPVDAARLTGMAVLTNGQVLLAGNYQSFNLVQLSGLARLNADGTLDSAFNPLISAQTLTPSIDSFLLLSNGQMLISGNFQFINNPAIATLARVNLRPAW